MAASVAPVAAATILNGSFETGTNPGATFSTLAFGSTAITGWTVGGHGIDYISSNYWTPQDGDRSIDLSGSNAGSIAQTVATVIGGVYTLHFFLSGNPDGGTGTKTAVVSVSGDLPDVDFYTVAPSNTRTAMNWQPYSYTFTAMTASTRLVFASATKTPYGPAIDNVSITGGAVPEPASWALMLVGFGLIGSAARRRAPSISVVA